jgi:hypothetical protein
MKLCINCKHHFPYDGLNKRSDLDRCHRNFYISPVNGESVPDELYCSNERKFDNKLQPTPIYCTIDAIFFEGKTNE